LATAALGSGIDAASKDSAVVASIALPHGVPVDVIRKALLRAANARQARRSAPRSTPSPSRRAGDERNQITAICCIVCSRVSERPLMAAEGEAEGEGIVICPHCLAEGDIDAKLERHAARLESRSRWLRALIGRLEVPSPAVLKEFAGPEDTEQAAVFWDSLSDLLDESELLPINQAAHRLVSLLQEYRGAWPLIKSDAEVDPEPGKALAAALVKRREFFGLGADL
jgi:hypothetical protein